MEGGRAHGEVLLEAIWYARGRREREEDVLGGVGLAMLDRGAIVCGREDALGRLTSEHVLGRLRCVARAWGLRAVRVVSGQRMGILLGQRGPLGERVGVKGGRIAVLRSVGRRRGEVVVGRGRRERLLRLWLGRVWPDHGHCGGARRVLWGGSGGALGAEGAEGRRMSGCGGATASRRGRRGRRGSRCRRRMLVDTRAGLAGLAAARRRPSQHSFTTTGWRWGCLCLRGVVVGLLLLTCLWGGNGGTLSTACPEPGA